MLFGRFVLKLKILFLKQEKRVVFDITIRKTEGRI